jgi:hypothetical protein
VPPVLEAHDIHISRTGWDAELDLCHEENKVAFAATNNWEKYFDAEETGLNQGWHLSRFASRKLPMLSSKSNEKSQQATAFFLLSGHHFPTIFSFAFTPAAASCFASGAGRLQPSASQTSS